jgi:hypothetical protein
MRFLHRVFSAAFAAASLLVAHDARAQGTQQGTPVTIQGLVNQVEAAITANPATGVTANYSGECKAISTQPVL